MYYLCEDGGFPRKLFADVLAGHENGLQIHPLFLHGENQVNGLRHSVERFLPLVDLFRERAVKFGCLYRGELNAVFFQHLSTVAVARRLVNVFLFRPRQFSRVSACPHFTMPAKPSVWCLLLLYRVPYRQGHHVGITRYRSRKGTLWSSTTLHPLTPCPEV